jgi:hypothetical protein
VTGPWRIAVPWRGVPRLDWHGLIPYFILSMLEVLPRWRCCRMAAQKGRLSIRGPSSPDLGQERPTDRLRPGALIDLGVRDDARATLEGGRRPPVMAVPRR